MANDNSKGLFGSSQGLSNNNDVFLYNSTTVKVTRESVVDVSGEVQTLNIIGSFIVTLDLTGAPATKYFYLYNTGLAGAATIKALLNGSPLQIGDQDSVQVSSGSGEGIALYWDGTTLTVAE